MSLPPTFRVKISSEDAGMAITPVVSRDMPLQELVLCILGVTGKDPVSIARYWSAAALSPEHPGSDGPAWRPSSQPFKIYSPRFQTLIPRSPLNPYDVSR
jgi:hypothetical protein